MFLGCQENTWAWSLEKKLWYHITCHLMCGTERKSSCKSYAGKERPKNGKD